MIKIIQGSPGSGKSAIALALGMNHLISGGALATNFELVKHWAWIAAGWSARVRCGFRPRMDRAMELYNRCFQIGTVETIFELSTLLNDCGLDEKYQKKREGKGLLIIDEAQLVFNSRQWDKNKKWIEFFTQHRKLGWDVILVAHYQQMIDKQIRPLIEIETRFRNLKNIRIPVIRLPLSPVDTFFSVSFYAGQGPGVGMVHSRDCSFLDKHTANLYDTCRVFAFDDNIQHIKNQGVHPSISAEALPNYMPDFLLGEKFAVYLKKKRLSLPSTASPRPKRAKANPFVPLSPEIGTVRAFY